MKDKSKRLNFIEGVLDTLMVGVLNNQNNQGNNPPTPSLNNFDKIKNENIIITKEEARQLRNLLDNLLKELYYKKEMETDRLIEDDNNGDDKEELKKGGEKVNDEQLLNFIDKIIKLENRFNSLSRRLNEIEEITMEDLHKEDLEEDDSREIQSKDRSYSFYDELRDHAKNFDHIKVLVVSGDSCCQIKGVIMDLQTDFIVLLGKGNGLIKILIDKIVAVERLVDKDKEGKYSVDNEDDKNKNADKDKEDFEEGYLEEFREGAAARGEGVGTTSEGELEERKGRFKVV